MRRGVTLLELLVVLVIVGLLAGMVVPGAASLADRLAVEHEAARLLVAYRSAWLTARVQHRLALLRVTSDSLAIWTVSSAGAPDTVLAWLAPGPGFAGVSILGRRTPRCLPHTARQWALPIPAMSWGVAAPAVRWWCRGWEGCGYYPRTQRRRAPRYPGPSSESEIA